MTSQSLNEENAHVAVQAKRYAFVGTGGRVNMFIDPIPTHFSASAKVVALCDTSMVRATYHQKRLQRLFGYEKVPIYPADAFVRMLRECRPDTVVVCTIDREHHHYIVESLRAGCNVVTEKPMTTDAAKCAAILQAAAGKPGAVRVAFNYRWANGATKVRELLKSGIIGRVWQVNLEYLLNTSHGADYFRRWHANKEDSGGLLVHKSTHHFDLVNWWIDGIPEIVYARGGLYFYGRENAVIRGDERFTRYPRYQGYPAADDPFAYAYEKSAYSEQGYERDLYLAAEKESGYVRDQNVFRTDISIEDAMSVIVQYRNGTLLNYSLNAFSPNEGYRVTFAGDRGRLEYEEDHGAHLIGESASIVGNEHAHRGAHRLRVWPHFRKPYDVDIPRGEGGHGGGDPLLQEQIYSLNARPDPFGRSAGHEQGAASVMVGVAANLSMARNSPMKISDLVSLAPKAEALADLI